VITSLRATSPILTLSSVTDSDKNFFRDGIVTAINAMLASGASEVLIPTFENIHNYSTWNPLTQVPIRSAAEAANATNLNFIPNQTFITAAHLQASNRAGTVAQGAVFSPRHRLWTATGEEVKNLYGCDSSVMPTSVGANPMQTLYTFAYILAQRLLTGDLKS
jgi:choline dehydrogenase-like flavoprotein